MAGHVFLVHGDIAKLACDAWLVPSGSKPEPGSVWKDAVSPDVPADTSARWSHSAGRVIPLGAAPPRRPEHSRAAGLTKEVERSNSIFQYEIAQSETCGHQFAPPRRTNPGISVAVYHRRSREGCEGSERGRRFS
jgi:hypothetical protein